MTSLPNPFDHTHLASRTDFSIFFLPIIILIYVIASAPGCRLECTFKGDEIFIACLWSFCKSESMVGNSRTDYLTLHKRKVSFTECVDVQCLGIITCSVLIIPTSIWRTHFHLQRDAKLIYYGNAKMACCILVLYFRKNNFKRYLGQDKMSSQGISLSTLPSPPAHTPSQNKSFVPISIRKLLW